jgi:hypothetical protein
MFGNMFLALKPLPHLTNKKVSCMELFGSEILNVEVVDSPETCTCLLQHVVSHHRRLKSELPYGASTYFPAVLNKLNAYEL